MYHILINKLYDLSLKQKCFTAVLLHLKLKVTSSTAYILNKEKQQVNSIKCNTVEVIIIL